jgi:hypothetical protein
LFDQLTLGLPIEKILVTSKTPDFMVVQQTADEKMPDNAFGVSGMTKAGHMPLQSSRKPRAAIRDRQKHNASR